MGDTRILKTMERIELDGIELSESQPDDRALLVGEILQRLEDEDPDCGESSP